MHAGGSGGAWPRSVPSAPGARPAGAVGRHHPHRQRLGSAGPLVRGGGTPLVAAGRLPARVDAQGPTGG